MSYQKKQSNKVISGADITIPKATWTTILNISSITPALLRSMKVSYNLNFNISERPTNSPSFYVRVTVGGGNDYTYTHVFPYIFGNNIKFGVSNTLYANVTGTTARGLRVDVYHDADGGSTFFVNSMENECSLSYESTILRYEV